MPDDLPTTSYAVLGLLALRSWTGYELVQQARRSLAFCWPKEDSVLYEEPRRLVAHVELCEPSRAAERARLQVRAHHLRALRREALHAGQPDPRRRARHQRDLS